MYFHQTCFKIKYSKSNDSIYVYVVLDRHHELTFLGDLRSNMESIYNKNIGTSSESVLERE